MSSLRLISESATAVKIFDWYLFGDKIPELSVIVPFKSDIDGCCGPYFTLQ